MSSTSMKSFRETIETIVVALILALFIRTFIVQAFKIPSGSMLETLQIGDHLLVSKFLYGVTLPFTDKVIIPVGDPERGDIIVFKFPEDESKDFIKRIIGLPGDVIRIEDKVVYVNGKRLDEPYTHHTKYTMEPIRDNYGPYKVPEGEYFMMGDNREESYDARWWGPVKREKIIGKALFIYWSWESLTDIRWSRLGHWVH